LVKDGSDWKPVTQGTTLGPDKEVIFPKAVTGSAFRINISKSTGPPATIREVKFYE
jgi:hypothetical protein